VSNRNEEDFNRTLKNLVSEQPGRLAYYNGFDPNAAAPPFVPKEGTLELIRRDTTKRKRLNIGMIASAAAAFVFAILTATSYVPDSVSPVLYSDFNKNVRVMMTDISQPIQEADSAVAPMSLFLICAIACAAAFAVLLLLKRKTSR